MTAFKALSFRGCSLAEESALGFACGLNFLSTVNREPSTALKRCHPEPRRFGAKDLLLIFLLALGVWPLELGLSDYWLLTTASKVEERRFSAALSGINVRALAPGRCTCCRLLTVTCELLFAPTTIFLHDPPCAISRGTARPRPRAQPRQISPGRSSREHTHGSHTRA